MSDILRSLIKWTEENGIVPEIYFATECGGIYLILKLRYHGKSIAHEIYIPGGVLCLQNWDSSSSKEEVDCFIEIAINELKRGNQ